MLEVGGGIKNCKGGLMVSGVPRVLLFGDGSRNAKWCCGESSSAASGVEDTDAPSDVVLFRSAFLRRLVLP